jgi:uncharacterized membrane protein
MLLLPFTLVSVLSDKTEMKFLDRNSSSVAKGIGILFVMLCHFMGDFGGGTVLLTPLGGIGVAIFLILSGYGLNESWTRGGAFLLVEKKNPYCCHTICVGRNRLLLAIS